MKRMRGVVLKKTGNIDGLEMQQVEIPRLKDGEVLVRLHASALNHRDLWIVKGQYAKIRTPVILGSDGAGEVVDVADGIDRDWLNRKVVINPGWDWGIDPRAQQRSFKILGMPDNGTQAEYVAVPIKYIVEKPSHLSWEEAAAIPLGGLTGYRALFSRGELKPGETVLLTGIGGGVATLMLQMAVAAGARVVVTSGSEAKIEAAKKLGALDGVLYTAPDWPKKVLELLNGEEPDLVVDSAGGKSFAELTGIVKPGGRIVFFGATTGLPDSLNLRQIFWKQISILGTTMGNPLEFAEMVRMFERCQIRPVIDKVFPLDMFKDAYRRMEKGGQFGKIILACDLK